MKIYDSERKNVLSTITLFLTPKEAKELASCAGDLAENPEKHHLHVTDDAFELEITVAVYTPQNLHKFDEESRALLSE